MDNARSLTKLVYTTCIRPGTEARANDKAEGSPFEYALEPVLKTIWQIESIALLIQCRHSGK
eukprot:777169-Pelagomonas_calceolata.AAC.1